MSIVDISMQREPVTETFRPTTVILSVGLDTDVLRNRSVALHAAGYIVVSAYSLKGAVDRFLGGDFDCVILCHSIPAKDRDRLACLIRASGSHTPVLCVSNESGSRNPFASETVGSMPHELVVCIREMLTRSENAWKKLYEATTNEVENFEKQVVRA